MVETSLWGGGGGQPGTEDPLGAGELLAEGISAALTPSCSVRGDPHLHWVVRGKKTNFWGLLKENKSTYR